MFRFVWMMSSLFLSFLSNLSQTTFFSLAFSLFSFLTLLSLFGKGKKKSKEVLWPASAVGSAVQGGGKKRKIKARRKKFFFPEKSKKKKVSRASHGRHFSSHIYSLKNQNVSSAWLIQSVNQCLGGMLSLFFLSEILAEKVLAQFEGKRGMTYVARKR